MCTKAALWAVSKMEGGSAEQTAALNGLVQEL